MFFSSESRSFFCSLNPLKRLFIACCCIVVFINFYKIKNSNYRFYETEQLGKCNPLRPVKQYTVKFDGFFYPQYVPSYFNVSLNFNCLNRGSQKRILLWNAFFNDLDLRYGLGKKTPFVKHKCPVTNCEVTNDKKRLSEADLVVVHIGDQFSPIPKEPRPLDQRWVYVYSLKLNLKGPERTKPTLFHL
jgi:hypothetical protein